MKNDIKDRLVSSQIRCFLALARHLHFGRAAAELGMAQPGLSQIIRRLEEDVGTELFTRTTRNVELTPSGQAFLLHAERAANESGRAADLARIFARGGTGRLRIGFIQPAMYGRLPAAIASMRRDHPDVDLDLIHMSSTEIAAGLIAGRLDLGLIRPPINTRGLRIGTIAREGFAAVLRPDHPKVDAKRLTVRDFADERFVYFRSSENDSFPEQVAISCRLNGFAPNFVAQTTSVAATLTLVIAGMGIAIMPRWTRNVAGTGLVFRPLDDMPTIVELSHARADDAAEDALAEAFIDRLTEAGAAAP
ncbi:LysR family transcriptional regulator [Acuticoccus kandeliae]|uniref:LysR family transcriptional regulator n=1 Tax=Acuticoccus kandeliae TaxID=2073160 RepID=UPI000D3ECE8E|nr:LysR family transcriptional regulator [Acuticoccus kandeliae]